MDDEGARPCRRGRVVSPSMKYPPEALDMRNPALRGATRLATTEGGIGAVCV